MAVGVAGFFSSAPAQAHELMLCDNTSCSGCWKKYSRTSIQIDLANLGTVAWDNCPGVMIGTTLRQIQRETPNWSAELYSQTNFQGVLTERGYAAGAWPITVAAGSVASLSLVGPAARFCQDINCTMWTDLVDLGEGSDTGMARNNYPGRIVRTNLGGGAGCPTLCEWKYWQDTTWEDITDMPAFGIHQSMNDGSYGISRVIIRNGLFQLNYCLGANFASCYGTHYRKGPLDVSLGSGWNDAISSFDLIRRRPNDLAPNWPLTDTCTSGGNYFEKPGTPTTCTSHAQCTRPYSCTTSGCQIAACYDWVSTGSAGYPKVFYREHISKNLIGVDFTSHYQAGWNSAAATRARWTAEAAWNFVRVEGPYAIDGSPPNAPAGHDYTYQVPSMLLYLPEVEGPPPWATHDDGMWFPYRDYLLGSNRPRPEGYLGNLQTMLHEYAHIFVGDHYLNSDGSGMAGLGFGEGLAVFFEQSIADHSFGTEQLVHDYFLQDWPYQEYCMTDAVTQPVGCYGMKYSGLHEYSTNLLGYNSGMTLAYLGSQFMTPVGGTAINPNSYPYFDPSNPTTWLIKPLRYHQFYRQVAEDLYLNRNSDLNSQRKAWVTRATNQASAGAQPSGTAWKRCTQDDPSDCTFGAGGTAFWDSTSFDTAFRRWAKTHVERYPAAIRSQMHQKFELGGKQGIKTTGGNDQLQFVSVPFELGPTTTAFTIIVTAQTKSKSEVLTERDSLRVYIDSDVSGNRPFGKRYDNEYNDGEQCLAFGHDFADSRGCKYWVIDHWETDGNLTDQRATMRFVPSSAFANFASGGSGAHTLYLAAYNNPIVYSVEVVKSVVTLIGTSTALHGYYCATGGDPTQDFCQLDDPLDLALVGAGGASGNKVIQVVAQADRLDIQGPLAGGGSWHEGLHIGVQMSLWNPDTTETKWFALHGWPMAGKPYLMRAEKNAGGGFNFWVRSHDTPFYHHVFTWDRPTGGAAAARYYPLIRGLQMHGYMFDPPGASFSMTVNSGGQGTTLNYYVFCETAGPTWAKLGEGTLVSGNSVGWTGMSCGRVYAMVGMAAPEDESPSPPPGDDFGRGQVLDIYFQGGL